MENESDDEAAMDVSAGREVNAYQQEKVLIRTQGFSISRRFGKDLEEMVIAINWLHITFKVLALSYVALVLWLTWVILPLPGHWSRLDEREFKPRSQQDLQHYFNEFDGYSECGIRVSSLYAEPIQDSRGFYADRTFCRHRKTLLSALSDGGRVGFNAPYIPKGIKMSRPYPL